MLAVAEPLIHPAHDVAGHAGKKFVPSSLESVDVIGQQAGIVVRHFFEVGHDPALIHGVAMEAAGELVINAAARHLLQRSHDDGAEKIFAGTRIAVNDEIHDRGMRKFWLRAEAPVLHVEEAGSGVDDRADNFRGKFSAAAAKSFCLGDGAHHLLGRSGNFPVLVAISSGYGLQHSLQAGTAVVIVGREVRPTVKRLAFRREKRGQRPAALPAHRRNGGLVAAVNIRPLIAIHFDGDEIFVDEPRHFGIVVGFAIHDVAPMAPDGADIQQHRLVLAARLGKSFFPPLPPENGLMHGGAQIRGSSFRQRVELSSRFDRRLGHNYLVYARERRVR